LNHLIEVVDFLKIYQLKPGDRPDLVSRLFKIKLDQLIKDIKKGTLFGKVKAGMFTHSNFLSYYLI
jgi:hypothetical protein